MKKLLLIILVVLSFSSAILAVDITYPIQNPIIVNLVRRNNCPSHRCAVYDEYGESRIFIFWLDKYTSSASVRYYSSSGTFSTDLKMSGSDDDFNDLLQLIFNISHECPVRLEIDPNTFEILKVEGKCDYRASVDDDILKG